VILAVYGSLGVSVLFLPLLFLLQAAFTVGAVWFMSCVNILYRDLSQVLGLAVVLLMFVSPIAYTPEMVPARLGLAVTLNPLSYLIEAYRAVLLRNHTPDVLTLALLFGLALLVLHTGYGYFMRLRRVLPDFA
jgi:lipopolysaccharide transport system permease protein